MTPRVCVIIDNYNYGRYLPAAIDSVLAQRFPADAVEIIVVDDGSTDDSRRVLERYAGKIQALFQKNQGYAAAFNNGINRAQAPIICLLDADDVWLPQKLARVVECFDKNPDLGLVQHFLQDTDAALTPLPVEFPVWPARVTLDDYLAGRTVFTATSALSFKREILLRALPIPTEMRFLYADDYLSASALLHAPGGNIPEALGQHRVHGANFCAGGWAAPEKLAADFRMRRVYRRAIDRGLAARGLTLSERFRQREDIELWRREILLHMQEGRRGAAARVWGQGLVRFTRSGFGLFRALTCALALISARLYLGLYERYARSRGVKSLRRSVLPD